ncbi:(Fe-S)-binding protein [Desulfoscipio gibsoniae]|uniref:CO dehydrogenase/acetyl-CoA synthase gamma subunit (Corrinoid Fe-S protein) n=1 Tax=Desulfoscipio gibsoniae DSM 7213 TaxID=767817 RepID=R4KIJ4_9FIRM|nr:(Fe-S)-binding protein [Desulfoscipio gibsoniae]AGL02444.1 CO dehydrogenase/acetyl-CoA synthase gamma subunit (corrinoid Fe-S protein) [Desulfoscipio gibsoniae DSM 7213]
MNQLTNPLEIYRLLPKTNCGACQTLTCLAFAAALINGQKSLRDCPHLEDKAIEQYLCYVHSE